MNIFPNKFRFKFIRTSRGTTQEYTLKYAPEEWNGNVIKWDRDKKSNTVLTKYVDNFTFVLQDSDFLRQCFAQERVFAKVRFVVEECDLENFIYAPYYSGDIDFYSYEEDKNSVKVSMLEIGYKVAFDANYDTAYEIELPTASDGISYDRLNLRNAIVYDCSTNLPWIDDKTVVLDAFVSSENVYANKVVTNSVFGDEKSNDNWMLKATADLQVLIHLDFSISTFPSDSEHTMYAKIYINDSAIKTFSAHSQESVFGNFTLGLGINDEFLYTLKQGDRLYITLSCTGGKVIPLGLCWGTFSVSYPSRGKSCVFKGLSPYQLLVKLVEKATDGKYSEISAKVLTTGEISNMLITSGNLIRRVSNAKITTSLKDFFEAMQAMFGLCYAFRVIDGREVMVVQHMYEVFDRKSKLTSVDEISELRTSVADNYIYNRMKIGYKDQTYDEMNGKFEFNTEVQFAVNTDAKSNELKLVSPYRADMYGIEFIIFNYEQNDTVDSQSDNDVFVVHVQSPTGDNSARRLNRNYKLVNQNPQAPAGETAFNVYLSPKNCLLRQIEYIRSLFMYSGDTLKFASSSKEFDAETANNTREWKDVPLSGNRLFTPLIYEFETNVPEGISDKIAGNGYVEVRDGENILRGFVLSVSENPGRNRSQKWKLLAME